MCDAQGHNQSRRSGTNREEESRLIEREHRAKGLVSRDILWTYGKAMGGFLPFSFLIAQFLAVELFRVGTNLWLTKWTSEYET